MIEILVTNEHNSSCIHLFGRCCKYFHGWPYLPAEVEDSVTSRCMLKLLAISMVMSGLVVLPFKWSLHGIWIKLVLDKFIFLSSATCIGNLKVTRELAFVRMYQEIRFHQLLKCLEL